MEIRINLVLQETMSGNELINYFQLKKLNRPYDVLRLLHLFSFHLFSEMINLGLIKTNRHFMTLILSSIVYII